MVHPLRQPPAKNLCSNKNCSHFCLLGRDATASCVCPEVSGGNFNISSSSRVVEIV